MLPNRGSVQLSLVTGQQREQTGDSLRTRVGFSAVSGTSAGDRQVQQGGGGVAAQQ